MILFALFASTVDCMLPVFWGRCHSQLIQLCADMAGRSMNVLQLLQLKPVFVTERTLSESALAIQSG